MHYSYKRTFLFALLLLLPLSAVAQQVLYATQACGRNCEGRPTGLYTIDPATGAATLVGDPGESITGLDFHPATGVLYGTTTPGSNNPSSLITIDPVTAAVDVIGPHGIDDAVVDLTFAPDGTLYGWLEPSFDDVVTLDLVSGAATVVGESDTNTAGCAFEFAPDGYLYLFGIYCDTPLDDPYDKILQIDPADGSVVDYWSLGQDSNQGESCLGWSAASQSDAGVVYGIRGAWCGDFDRELATVDLQTGEVTVIGDTLDWASGLAWGGSAYRPVPTLGQYGVWIMIAIVGLLGIVAHQRRRAA